MRKGILWLSVVGFFGLLASANAQTPQPSTAGTQFDGKYAFASSTKLNETFTAWGGRLHQCADRIAGPLTIESGQARYSGSSLHISKEFEGTVGSQGELAMRSNAPGLGHPIEITVSGRIDGNGTVRARQSGYSCNYDFTWRKESK